MSGMNWGEESKKSQGGVDVVAGGSYKVEISGWQESEASTGTKQVRWFATVVMPDNLKGSKLCDHTALTPNALWRLAKLVGACGVDISNAPTTELMSDAFKNVLDKCVNRKVWWKVSYNSQYKNNKIDDYVAVDESEQPVIAVGDTPVDSACPFEETKL